MVDHDPVSHVIAGYDRLASRWDQWAETVHPRLREYYLEYLKTQLEPGAKVLELGSGTGRPVAQLLAADYEYLGVDASSLMVATAQANVPSARFLEADMRTPDLPSGKFDAVVAFYSIIHVPRDEQPALFARIHGWLRPGGYFLACLSAGDLPAGWEEDWLGAGPMFWSGYDAETNRRLLAEAGFDVVEAEVRSQIEGDQHVRFQWMSARAGSAGINSGQSGS